MKRFVINASFTLILLLIICFTIVGKRGYFHMLRLHEELHAIESVNTKLKIENEKLKAEISNLKNDLRFLEELSRNELGLSREDELIYRPEQKK
jgi:cell division protein FtsB